MSTEAAVPVARGRRVPPARPAGLSKPGAELQRAPRGLRGGIVSSRLTRYDAVGLPFQTVPEVGGLDSIAFPLETGEFLRKEY